MENEAAASHTGTRARNWKEFTVNPPATRTGLYASINQRGFITLNRRTWELAGAPKSVSLLYDDEDGNATIGLRPVSHLMPNAFPVAMRPDGTNAWIRAHEFLTKAAIEISYCIRFLDPHMEADTLILDLNHTTRVIGARKRK